MSGTATATLPAILTHAVRGSALAEAYQAGASELSSYYYGRPTDADAYARRAAEVRQRLPAAARRRLVEALRPTTAGAAAKLERILNGEGCFVTTGQQPALLGGPLYTLYKTLTAVKLAETLEARLGEPVLAVFWVASDDHDWDEASRTWLVDPLGDLCELALDDDGPPVSMGVRVLPDRIRGIVEEAIALLPDSGFTRQYALAVRSEFAPGRTLSNAFHELLRALLANFDLATLDGAHPALKRAAAPVLRRELENFAAHTAALRRQTERLVADGFHAQVTISDEAANVFYEDEHGRERLVREDNGWLLRRTKRPLPEVEVYALLEEEPERFSANVLLRPVVESAVLPTVSYVGGPGEIAYFGQIGCLFAAHGIAPPVVRPRTGVTIVERKVAKVLDKFGLTAGDVERPWHELASAIVRAELPEQVTAAESNLEAAVRHRYDELAAGAEAIDPTLRGWLEAERNRALSRVRDAGRKIARHLRKRSEVELAQLRRAAVNLFPLGAPQERVLNALPYLARYGPELLSAVAAAIEVPLDGRADGWDGVHCEGDDADAARLPVGLRVG